MSPSLFNFFINVILATLNIQSFQPKRVPVLWMVQRKTCQCWRCKKRVYPGWLGTEISCFIVFSVPAENVRGRVDWLSAIKGTCNQFWWIRRQTGSCKVKLAETEVYIVNVYFPSGNEGVPIHSDFRLRLEALGNGATGGLLAHDG